jgi:hypothetical protein
MIVAGIERNRLAVHFDLHRRAADGRADRIAVFAQVEQLHGCFLLVR